jgi:hypothetical protein
MDDITAIDDEVRGIVERNWSHLVAKLPPKGRIRYVWLSASALLSVNDALRPRIRIQHEDRRVSVHSRFELVIILKTARALGIDPQTRSSI